jgi:predicted DNA-binding antitoxin AbrB/MazE fold protein
MELSEGERFEIEYNCRKKIEEVAKQWKDKLIEIVNNYENEGDKNTK